jgi:polysaccharide export outer membrane protein
MAPLKVEGLTPPEMEGKLVKLYKEGDFILDPQITVFVKEYRHQRVMITGGVVAPGSYEVIGPRTLLEMLGKSGGLNDKAGDRVHIIRSQSAADVARAIVISGIP